MPDYLPHTDEDIARMLEFLGLRSLEELFDAVPAAVRLTRELALDEGRPEPDALARARARAGANRAAELVCFAGAGAYDHEVPPVVRALASRSEFVTAYTPYQAEVAQGVLVSCGVHPHWRAVLGTFAAGTGHELVEVPLVAGRTDWDAVAEPSGAGAVVAAYPNYLGCLEDLGAARSAADHHGGLLAVAADPVALGVLKSPGEWGADVAVGEGQPFGSPLAFGGPYLGLFACAAAHVRRLPGRLVGETRDADGTVAYVTTLRAREQDIRREKATSNVCTNQTLIALTAAIQLGWLGTAGLAELATRCARAADYCRRGLLGLEGVEPLTAHTPTLREFAVALPVPAALLQARLAEEGFLAGVALDQRVGEDGDGSMGAAAARRGLLVAVTERRTREEIDRFVAAFDKALR